MGLREEVPVQIDQRLALFTVAFDEIAVLKVNELPARMGFSAEYLQAVARVELERILAANLKGE